MMRVSSSRGGGGDPETERRRIETEKHQARMMTIQNVVLFTITCGIIRAGKHNLFLPPPPPSNPLASFKRNNQTIVTKNNKHSIHAD